MTPAMTELTRTVRINSLHQLALYERSSEENQALYGSCHLKHGHNYQISVTVRGSVNENSGQHSLRTTLDQLIQTDIVEKLDRNDLNDVFGLTTGEAVAGAIYQVFEAKLPAGSLMRVRIQQDRLHSFEYPPVP